MGVVVSPDTASGEHSPGRRRRPRGWLPLSAIVVLAGALAVITLDDPEPPTPPLGSELAIPEAVVTTPLRSFESGDWVEIGVATGDLFGAHRIPAGYAFPTDGGIVVIRDDGTAVRAQLDSLGLMRGIAADSDRAVVFGTAATPRGTAPTLWVSEDGLSWTAQRLPWQGAAESVTFDEGRILVAGTQSTPDGLSGILAREGANGTWQLTTHPSPHSRPFPIEGGFVVSAKVDDAGLALYTTTDFRAFEPFADWLSVFGQGLVAGVVFDERGQRLRVPDLDLDFVPPSWLPVVSLWGEPGRIWMQTPSSLWTSTDGGAWDELPLDRLDWGAAMAIPIGDTARMAVRESGGVVRLFEWQPTS